MKEKNLQVWQDEVTADFPSSEAVGNEDWIAVPPEDMPSDLPDDWALPVGESYEPDAFFEASAEDGFATFARDFAPFSEEASRSGAAQPQTDDDPNGDFKLLDDPLRGRTLIEASAGTGKTYSLEHIVLRLVVERGIAIGRVLVVTFTKAATAELKSRIRGKLIAVRKLVTEGVAPTDKNLLEQFERWSELDPDLVCERLDRAVREFDDAVILTIHSFCQKTLSDFVFTSGGSYGVDSGNENELLDRTVEEFLRLEARRANEKGATEAFRVLQTLKLDKALSKLAAEPESARKRAIFSEAGFPEKLDAENAAALTVSFLVSVPLPRILMPSRAFLTMPALQRISAVTSAPSSNFSRAETFTLSSGLAKMLWKPRFGMRRARGIWPPSKPMRTPPPLRAFWPL